MVDAERLEEELRQPFALVGANRELGARLTQSFQRGDGPGEGAALRRDIGFVVDEEVGQDVVRADPGAKSLEDHGRCPAANGLAHALCLDGPVPMQFQRVIQGVGEVRGRIDECPVEIEDDCDLVEHDVSLTRDLL